MVHVQGCTSSALVFLCFSVVCTVVWGSFVTRLHFCLEGVVGDKTTVFDVEILLDHHPGVLLKSAVIVYETHRCLDTGWTSSILSLQF